MKHWIACLSLLAALFTTGCDTVNHSQIQVLSPKGDAKTRATVPVSDREFVKQVLKDIATKLRFEDRTKLSLIPEAICSYAQPDVKHPMRVVAWVSHDRICIDLFQKPPEAGETEAYRQLRDQIISELEKQFGERLTLVNKMNEVTAGPSAIP